MKRNLGKDSQIISIFSFPMPSNVNVLLYSLVEILKSTGKTVLIVTSKIPDGYDNENVIIKDLRISLHFRNDISPKWWSNLLQILKLILIQIKMSWILISMSNKIDIVIFYIGGANLIIPILIAKILKKKIMFSAIGLGSMSYKNSRKRKTLLQNTFLVILSVLEHIIFYVSDKIIVESVGVIKFLNLERYYPKIITNGARYIDIKKFKVTKKLKDRKNIIGYIGRLEEGKGINNLLKVIPHILIWNDSIKFIIIGDGPLRPKVKALEKNLNPQKIELLGWINHDEIATYLNELRLLILPSYSEGLPTIMLESMACETPILSTPVGGVPDLIKEGITGFIIKDNSPETISNHIKKIIGNPNLEEICKNARMLIEKDFTFDASVKRWKRIIESI